MGESYPKLIDVYAKCERLFDGIEDKHLSVAIAYAQLTSKLLK